MLVVRVAIEEVADVISKFRSAAGQLVVTPRDSEAGSPKKPAAKDLEKRLGEGEDDPGDGGKAGAGGGDGAGLSGEPGDCRTLYVDYDTQGKRFKEWKQVCDESSTEVFSDFPISGPQAAVDMCKHFLRHGGSPKLWAQEWYREKQINGKDRTFHELSTLVEVIYVAGTYDCLNVGALASIEIVMRRIISIVEAHAVGSTPDWGNSRYYSGTANPLDLVPRELRHHVTREAKDDLEVQQMRQKSKSAAAIVDAHWVSGAVDSGGLPTDPARVKDKRAKGKSKGKKADGSGGGAEVK